MMSKQEDILIQRLTVIRKEEPFPVLDRAFLKELTYVETADLSGPRLIFTMDDYHRIIRDDLGIREKEVVEVVFSDRFQRDGLDSTVRFVILTMPIEGRWITFNCIELSVYRLKIPAKQTMVFRKMSVSAILQKLVPGIKCDVGSFPTQNDFHLLAGMRPSKLVRQMAQELGAVCFWQRGRLVFKKLKELYAAAPAITYSHNDPRNVNQILTYAKPNTGAVIQDRTERNYIGWDMVQGLQKSLRFPNAASEFSSASKECLNNLAEIPKPCIDFTAAGNGHLIPGIALKMVWNTDRADQPIDESLPGKAVVGTVAHAWRPQSYFCQVGGVKP